MTGALIILAVTAAIGLALYLADRLYYRRKTEDTPEEAANEEEETADGECCGMHIVCEKETLSPFTTEAEYFDDEELDEYRGTAADAYTPEQAEQFRDILMTMRPEEVSASSCPLPSATKCCSSSAKHAANKHHERYGTTRQHNTRHTVDY